MKIIIFWDNKESENLYNTVSFSLQELWLEDFIELEKSIDNSYKEKVNFEKEPALIVEEKNIDFIDVIFEWITPNEEEIKWMLISIIWWNSTCETSSCWIDCFC